MNNQTLTLLSCVALSLAACGGDDDMTTDSDTSASSTDDGGSTGDASETGDAGDGDGDGDGDGATADIRVIHLGVNVPAVDVFANGGEPAVIEALDFKESSGYLSVAPGEYTFEVAVSPGAPADAVLAPMVTLEADTKYSAVAIGDLNATDAGLMPMVLPLVDDDAGIDAANFRLQVVHAAPAVPTVDIWEISGTPALLLDSVPFGGNATLADIPAGALELGFDLHNPTPDGTPDVTFSVPDVMAGGLNLNVFAVNDALGAVTLQIVTPADMGTQVLEIPTN